MYDYDDGVTKTRTTKKNFCDSAKKRKKKTIRTCWTTRTFDPNFGDPVVNETSQMSLKLCNIIAIN